MGFRLPNLYEMYNRLKCNIFAVHYRGYGASEGEPSEQGLQLDAEAVFEYVSNMKEVDSDLIILFGRSLGGAVAIYLASKYPNEIAGTIVENTFTCISDMVDRLFPFLKPLKKYLLRIDWPSHKRVPLISHPILFLAGQKVIGD
jgi:pimeloyl-ACP methyl ester carboxylesterase